MSETKPEIRYEMTNADERNQPNNSAKICGYQRRAVLIVGLVVLVLVVIVVVAVLLAIFLGGETAPGLIYEPNLGHGYPIMYDRDGRSDETRLLTNRLNDLIQKYEGGYGESGQHYMHCSSNHNANYEDGVFCVFQDTWFSSVCSKHENFGYGRDRPCVFLLFNEVENWVPEPFETIHELPASMPYDLRQHIGNVTSDNYGEMPKMLWISCEGRYPSDKELLGPIRYSPFRGFPTYYFPYVNHPGYLAPMVAIEVVVLEEHVVVNIVCKIWDKNVPRHHEDGHGTVSIEMVEI